MFMLRDAKGGKQSWGTSWGMDFILTGNSWIDGAVDITVGLKSFIELLTRYNISFSTALPNHRDLQDLDINLMKPLRPK